MVAHRVKNFRLVTCTDSLSVSYLSPASGLQRSAECILWRYNSLADQRIGARRR